MFTTRSKSRGAVDRTVSQLRLDGEWIPLVPGSFYADGDGGFACTAVDTTLGVRAELTGSLWSIEELKREDPIGAYQPAGFRDPRRLGRGRGAADTCTRLLEHLSNKGTPAGPSF